MNKEARKSDVHVRFTGGTVEQLLTHTSRLTGSHGEDPEPLTRQEAVATIGALEQDFPAGSDFLYSNADYTLLALIVDSVGDEPFRDCVTSLILRLPDGDTAGGFWDGDPAASACGGAGPTARAWVSASPSPARSPSPTGATSRSPPPARPATDAASCCACRAEVDRTADLGHWPVRCFSNQWWAYASSLKASIST